MTAETAVALPSLVLVLAFALWAVAAATAQLSLVDAARSGARALARDEPVDAVTSAVERAAPRGVTVAVVDDDDLVRVEVALVFEPPGLLGTLVPGLPLHASAAAPVEALAGP